MKTVLMSMNESEIWGRLSRVNMVGAYHSKGENILYTNKANYQE
jgi:hypothetical protein